MTLEESARLYLADYYLLEEARDSANRFLQDIGQSLAASVREQLGQRVDSPVKWGGWVQKEGGALEFWVDEQDIPQLQRLEPYKYSVAYRDTMRTGRLSDTTKCRIYGSSPKSSAAAAAELKRMAKALGLPDPYADNEFDLLDGSVDEVVERLTEAFMALIDGYVQIAQALAKEPRGA